MSSGRTLSSVARTSRPSATSPTPTGSSSPAEPAGRATQLVGSSPGWPRSTATWYEAIAERIRQGSALPEMILVTNRVDGPLVVLEGHARLTGYLLAAGEAPAAVEVFGIISKSPVPQ